MLWEVFGASVKVEAHPATGTPHVVVMPEGAVDRASEDPVD